MSTPRLRCMSCAIVSRVVIHLTVLAICPPPLHAEPVGPEQARQAVAKWIQIDRSPFGMALGNKVDRVDTHAIPAGHFNYYLVYLAPNGFVVVSGDDLIEPILAFGEGTQYRSFLDNPLGALVINDLASRVATVAALQAEATAATRLFAPVGPLLEAKNKWARLLSSSAIAASRKTLLSDTRVSPLLATCWDQATVGGIACYNYYTPPGIAASVDNYPAGCFATALAQLLYYHKFPSRPTHTGPFTITTCSATNCSACSDEPRYLRGGDGFGGDYDWSNMPLLPGDSPSTLENNERMAIGAISHDAGVAARSKYCSSMTSVHFYNGQGASALRIAFGYRNAVDGTREDRRDIGGGLVNMIKPNLDAAKPVLLGITGADGHFVVCDGYGYDSSEPSTLYYHLNLGWGGNTLSEPACQHNVWYNLPTVDPIGDDAYTKVVECIYNIFTVETGEIISGRITDPTGQPIGGVVVTAHNLTNGQVYTATSSTGITQTNKIATGIYAITGVPPATWFDLRVAMPGCPFSTSGLVFTGTSSDGDAISGNLSGQDFESDPLLPPYLLTASQNDFHNKIRLSWNSVNAAPHAEVWRSSQNAFSTAQKIADNQISPYEDVPLASGAAYYYWVKTQTPCGTSEPSASAFGTTSNATLPVALRVRLGATGANNGSSWVDAHTSLAEALSHAAQSGGTVKEIWVAAGTYKPAGQQIPSFVLVDQVGVYGGFIGNETYRGQRDWLNNTTILSGDIGVVGQTSDNCDHVVDAGDVNLYTVLDGFVIRDGHAAYQGGGMWIGSGSPSIVNCTFMENYSGDAGGALYNAMGSPQIVNCTFVDNTAGWVGGGVLNDGGYPTFTRCRFIRNWATAVGGGMYNGTGVGPCEPWLVNCSFTDNAAGELGGAITNSDTNTKIYNCLFTYNSAERGGAIENYNSLSTVRNCTFYYNWAIAGAAVYNSSESGPNISNSIVWANLGGEDAQIAGPADVFDCCIQNGWSGPGQNNIDTDPRFADASGGDFSLSACSPCINAGDGALPANVATDLAGNPRVYPQNGTIDMGAYEFHQAPLLPPAAVTIDRSSLCANDSGSVTLTATGGSGTSLQWFTGSCGGTLLGVGNRLVLPSPESTTTYLARWGASCGNSSCVGATITVNPVPAPPAGATAIPAVIDPGGSSQLSATPGGFGDTVEWFTGSCGGTLVGTGVSIIVRPTETTSYYARTSKTGMECVSTTCVGVEVRIRVAPDLDQDNDVDWTDFTLFRSCVSGPCMTHSGTTLCQQSDFDHDTDVDQDDFGILQRCLSGPGLPANGNCCN